MQITFDTDNLSGLDLAVLDILRGGDGAPPVPATVKPAPKAEAPVSQPVAAPVAEAEAPVEEPAEDVSDVTRDDAVAAATKLVSSGKAQVVRDALSNLGVKKVSELPDESLAAFVNALG